MKKSELRKIIKEEIRILKESFNLNDRPTSVKSLNKFFKDNNVKEMIAKGKYHVYFYSGRTNKWDNTKIDDIRLKDKTYKEWLDTVHKMSK